VGFCVVEAVREEGIGADGKTRTERRFPAGMTNKKGKSNGRFLRYAAE
jgi:hypothetical protein